MTKNNPKIIFFGNGPLADAAKSTLLSHGADIIFHARTKDDLETVKQLKTEHPEAHGVLASFGVIVKSDVLDLFEPEGILNIHPSLLPDLRGASPIESAILRGDTTFGVSVMKLVKTMDAGPIFYQTTLDFDETTDKFTIYAGLATAGAEWLSRQLLSAPVSLFRWHKNTSTVPSFLPSGTPQDDSKATYCGKLATDLSELQPTSKSARTLQNEVRAFAKFPKSRFSVFGHDCIIHKTHVSSSLSKGAYLIVSKEIQLASTFSPLDSIEEPPKPKSIALLCCDGNYLYIDQLQPANKKIMDARSFINGYAR